MYHNHSTSSRRGGRAGSGNNNINYRGNGSGGDVDSNNSGSRSYHRQQQPPEPPLPSNAAAKAAAAAKVLHRRAIEKARKVAALAAAVVAKQDNVNEAASTTGTTSTITSRKDVFRSWPPPDDFARYDGHHGDNNNRSSIDETTGKQPEITATDADPRDKEMKNKDSPSTMPVNTASAYLIYPHPPHLLPPGGAGGGGGGPPAPPPLYPTIPIPGMVVGPYHHQNLPHQQQHHPHAYYEGYPPPLPPYHTHLTTASTSSHYPSSSYHHHLSHIPPHLHITQHNEHGQQQRQHHLAHSSNNNNNNNSRRIIIGSHTPIHVPRASSPCSGSVADTERAAAATEEAVAEEIVKEMDGFDRRHMEMGEEEEEEEEKPLPYWQPLQAVLGGGSGGSDCRSSNSTGNHRVKSVFRKSTRMGSGSTKTTKKNNESNYAREGEIEQQHLYCYQQQQTLRSGKGGAGDDHLPAEETNAHEILLSLSKSFDRMHKRRGPTTATTELEGGEQQQQAQRPNSPAGPPRIQHWHKQSSGSDCSSFEVRFTSHSVVFGSVFPVSIYGRFYPSRPISVNNLIHPLLFGFYVTTLTYHVHIAKSSKTPSPQ